MTLKSDLWHELDRLIEAQRRALVGVCAPQGADYLRALEGARRRLADGTFGTCVECGRDIDIDRLIAHPAAERCLECQQRVEHEDPARSDRIE
jgi:RNA polymerase-binding transcription factor DksA